MDQQSLQQLHDKFIETYEKSLELFPELKNWKRPSFRIDITGTTAGKAIFAENTIRVHPGIYLKNKEEFLKVTIPHEFSHLIAAKLLADYGHGEGWAKVMKRFGLPPTRCHNFDMEGLQKVGDRKTADKTEKYYYLYYCKCTDVKNCLVHKYPQRLHSKSVNKTSTIRCNRCNQYPRFMNMVIETSTGKVLTVS